MNRWALNKTVSLAFVVIFLATAFVLASLCCPLEHLRLEKNHGLHLGPSGTGHNISHTCISTPQITSCRFMLGFTPAHSWNKNFTEVIPLTPTPGIHLLRHSHRNIAHSIDHLSNGTEVPLFLRNLSLLI